MMPIVGSSNEGGWAEGEDLVPQFIPAQSLRYNGVADRVLDTFKEMAMVVIFQAQNVFKNVHFPQGVSWACEALIQCM